MTVGEEVLVEMRSGDTLTGRVVLTAPDYVVLCCAWGTAHVQRNWITRTHRHRPED